MTKSTEYSLQNFQFTQNLLRIILLDTHFYSKSILKSYENREWSKKTLYILSWLHLPFICSFVSCYQIVGKVLQIQSKPHAIEVSKLSLAAGSWLKFPFICYTGLLKKCLKFNQNPINSQNFRALSYTFPSLFYYRIVEKELQIQSKAHKFSKNFACGGQLAALFPFMAPTRPTWTRDRKDQFRSQIIKLFEGWRQKVYSVQ